MRKAAELVRPGGILVLSTPSMAGVSFWLLRDRRWLIGTEEHLFLFAPRTIDHLLGQTGFEVRSLQTSVVDYYYLFHTLVGRTAMPLHIRMAEGGAAQEATYRDIRSGFRVSTIWSKLKARLLDPIGRIIHRRNWADTLVVWAGRRE